MTRLSYRKNVKTGVTYIYSIERSYWDKEKKSPRNKQVCLGKLDSVTRAVISAKHRQKKEVTSTPLEAVTAVTRIAGPYLLLEKLTKKLGLDAMLKKCFPDKWQFMLSLVYFIVHKGLALSRAEQPEFPVCN